jgi:hypothetical protein
VPEETKDEPKETKDVHWLSTAWQSTAAPWTGWISKQEITMAKPDFGIRFCFLKNGSAQPSDPAEPTELWVFWPGGAQLNPNVWVTFESLGALTR